ncbi:S9 family peptidase [Caulobacter sp. KR2-114]|uniref:S9 family peptidase n=1 Tax=Caulobacter sp. KR2-114 TaxID=3400912 RepID=UPI003C01C2FC
MAEPIAGPVAPIPSKRPETFEKFGVALVDDYAWVRNPDWFNRLRTPERLEPEIRAVLDAENAYADAVLAPTQDLQRQMVAEMLARSGAGEGAPPQVSGGWRYAWSLPPGAEHPALSRQPLDGGLAQMVLDVQAESAGKPYYRLSDFSDPTPSPDHRLFAWAADEAGDQHFRLYVREIETGRLASPVIESCYGEFCFSPDSRWLYWVWRDPVSRPTKVFRRPAMGGEDVLIYEETDPRFFIALEKSRADAWVFIRLSDGESSETWAIPGDDPTAPPRLIEPRTPQLLYDVDAWRGRFVIRTNADGATDYKLVTADPTAPGRAHWQAWIDHQPGRFIAETRSFRGHYVLLAWVDANPTLVVLDGEGGERGVAMADEAYALAFAGGDFDSPTVTFAYESPRTPPRWIACDLASGDQTVVGQRTAGDFDAADYVVRRLFATAEDGASVPITVLRHRDTPIDGTAPLYLYAYGSYGYSIPPDFSPQRLALADRGVVCAIAHVRGGGERGPGWFAQARRTGKRLSISDFIACAEHLIATRHTGVGRVVAHSFSAGGIIVGAAANWRPELWAGLINQVPFVDVVRSCHDTSNPLIPGALAVWGDPADEAVFRYLASYSPYDNITEQAYPAALALGGLLDNRVGYWEPAKWAMRLREKSTSGRPVLLKIDMTAGHQGHAGLMPELERAALVNAFTLWATGRA